jgi:hypothetical protein
MLRQLIETTHQHSRGLDAVQPCHVSRYREGAIVHYHIDQHFSRRVIDGSQYPDEFPPAPARFRAVADGPVGRRQVIAWTGIYRLRSLENPINARSAANRS